MVVIYIILFIGATLLWPPVWSDIRFIIPIIPFIYLLVPRTKRFMLLITSILGVCFLFVSFRFEERNNKEYIGLAKMLTEYVPKGSVVMTRKPEIFYYYTGIKAVPYPQKVVDTIDVDYVLVENSPGMANIARFVNGKRLLLMVPDKYALVKMRP